jgi:PhoH-like ATPase
MAKKTYILDTNVLIFDPNSIFQFEDNDVVIPVAVLEETDRFKKEPAGRGVAAREINRSLSKLSATGSLDKGVPLGGGGTLRVVIHFNPIGQLDDTADHRILAVARDCGGILVTKDLNLRVKASAYGVKAEDYETDKVDFSKLYTGYRELYVSPETITAAYKNGGVPLIDLEGQEDFLADTPVYVGLKSQPPAPNECFMLVNYCDLSNTALATYNSGSGVFLLLPSDEELSVSGISARNREQKFALNMLLDPDIKLVTLVGRSGGGKTLLALAAGLHMVGSIYNKMIVGRPAVDMGNGHGFLPGDISEKLAPWMQPIKDNLDLLLSVGDPGSHDKKAGRQSGMQELVDHGMLELIALNFIRGRSIPDQYIVIDESQNTTPHEIKAIVTRAGEGTKIILSGDPEQIDSVYLDASSNGLSYVVERFRNEPIAASITLNKGERSELAEIAARIL